jgi:hypothetical protein
VKWRFTIPSGCLQVKDIRIVSQYGNEDEVLIVPYTAVSIDEKVQDSTGRTIYATVLRDSMTAPLDLATILA